MGVSKAFSGFQVFGMLCLFRCVFRGLGGWGGGGGGWGRTFEFRAGGLGLQEDSVVSLSRRRRWRH